MATIEMCYYCFETLEKHFDEKTKINSKRFFENKSYPIFVTLDLEKDNKKYLRGCIGTFKADKLYDLIPEITMKSAFYDTRFKPLEKNELKDLACEVSLLVDFEDANDIYDWELGINGIIINFKSPITGMETSATYLPEVAPDNNWDKKQTLINLIRKAGYYGGDFDNVIKSIKLKRYKTSKYYCNYKQYKKWKTDNQ